MPRRRVRGVLEFPGGLDVQADVLGSTFNVTIGGRRARLECPTSAPGSTSLEPPAGAALPSTLAALSVRWGHQRAIGKRASDNQYRVEAVRASFLGTPDPANLPSGYPEFDDIVASFFPWWGIVIDWLSAWLKTPSVLPDLSRDSFLHVVSATGGLAGSGIVGNLIIVGAPVANGSQVAAAFDRASKGRSLPPQHQLSLAARNARWGRDPRRAVIDAGTAAEVALATALRAELKRRHVSEAFIDEAIKDANGVVGLYDQYVALIGSLPLSRGAVMNKLALVRNNAAHGGVTPTNAEMDGALTASEDLVSTATPVPAP